MGWSENDDDNMQIMHKIFEFTNEFKNSKVAKKFKF